MRLNGLSTLGHSHFNIIKVCHGATVWQTQLYSEKASSKEWPNSKPCPRTFAIAVAKVSILARYGNHNSDALLGFT